MICYFFVYLDIILVSHVSFRRRLCHLFRQMWLYGISKTSFQYLCEKWNKMSTYESDFYFESVKFFKQKFK